MISRQKLAARVGRLAKTGVPITNYGFALSWFEGPDVLAEYSSLEDEMTLLLILLSFQLPAGEGAVVMLSGIPAEPWAALSTEQLEEMWTFGIEGYQVTRSGWSGYILRGPGGSGEILTDLCEALVGRGPNRTAPSGAGPCSSSGTATPFPHTM